MDRRPLHRYLEFPNPVNETSARVVAAGVVVQGIVFLVIREWWVLVPLAAGFLARVLSGPRFSPLGLFATRVVTPRLPFEHRLVAGPPKRFAQGVGLVFSGGALMAMALGNEPIAVALIVGLMVAASLESGLGLCLGCLAFNRLMRWGIVPESVCEACNDIRPRLALRVDQQA